MLLGDAARLIPDGPVVVVPTGRLHGVPWALLPALAGPGVRGRAVGGAVAAGPSRPRAGGRRRSLLAGPGLGTGGAEVPVLAARQPRRARC